MAAVDITMHGGTVWLTMAAKVAGDLGALEKRAQVARRAARTPGVCYGL